MAPLRPSALSLDPARPVPGRGRGRGRGLMRTERVMSPSISPGKLSLSSSRGSSRRSLSSTLREGIVLPLLDKAFEIGMAIETSRARQRQFEMRQLPRPVFTASLFSSFAVRAPVQASVTFVPADGLGLYCSREEVLRLPLGSVALTQLALASFVDTPPRLPTDAPLHSLSCDNKAGRLFALHTDGWLLIWDANHGELLFSTRLLDEERAAAMPALLQLLTACPTSGLLMVNLSWCDGHVVFYEPLAADAIGKVTTAAPAQLHSLPSAGAATASASASATATGLLFLQSLELLLVAFDGLSPVFGFDTAVDGLAAQLGGHTGGPPLLCSASSLRRAVAETSLLEEDQQSDELVVTGGADGSIRMWRLRRVLSASDGAAGIRARVQADCLVVLVGHTGRITCMCCLQGAALLASASVDLSIRFWDATAQPHLLTAPEGGAHAPTLEDGHAQLRPEWTQSNPPFVNCLTLHTADVPISLAAASDWSGPEALLVLTSPASPASSGSLTTWSISRTIVDTPARRFDEPLAPSAYMAIEAAAAEEWRSGMEQLGPWAKSQRETFSAEQRERRAAAWRATEHVCAAMLTRDVAKAPGAPPLDTFIERHSADAAFKQALLAQGGTDRLLLQQAYSFFQTQALLCAPLNSPQALRTWLDELVNKRHKAAHPAGGHQGVRDGLNMWRGAAASFDADAFRRLLNDLDPFARLRDRVTEIIDLAIQLRARMPAPRGAARDTAERCAMRWAIASGRLIAGLCVAIARVRYHAGLFALRDANALLHLDRVAQHAREPVSVGSGIRLDTQASSSRGGARRSPTYSGAPFFDEAVAPARGREIVHYSYPFRRIFRSADGSLCVAAASTPLSVTERAFSMSASTAAADERARIEVGFTSSAASRSLFCGALSSRMIPPRPSQPMYEVEIVFPWLGRHRNASSLLGVNGPLQGRARVGVLRWWGHQLMSALKAAHSQCIILRTLRLCDVFVSADGHRLQLGPAALTHYVLTDGSLACKGGRPLAESPMPPLTGPLTGALMRTQSLDEPRDQYTGAPGQHTTATALDEDLLPPELLAEHLGTQAELERPESADTRPLPISAACDVYLVGAILFELLYGQPPMSVPAAILRQCRELQLDPTLATPVYLRRLAEHVPTAPSDPEGPRPPPRLNPNSAPRRVDSPYTSEVPPLPHDPFAGLQPPAGTLPPLRAHAVEMPSKGRPWLAQLELEGACASPLVSISEGNETLATGVEAWAVEREIKSAKLCDLLFSCLHPNPKCRPTVEDLLASGPLCYDPPTAIAARSVAAGYLALPDAKRMVEASLSAPLRQLQRLSVLSRRFPVQGFEELVRATLACTSRPMAALSAAAAALGAADALPENATHALASLVDGAEGLPTESLSAVEATACRALFHEVIVRCDIWGVLRVVALGHFSEAVKVGAITDETVRDAPQAEAVGALGAALRRALASAMPPPPPSSRGAPTGAELLAPHVRSLAHTLLALCAGDTSLTTKEAPLITLGDPAPTDAGRAARVEPLSESYIKWIAPACHGKMPRWANYAPERAVHWSLPLQRVLAPTLTAVFTTEGVGSLMMPALRQEIRTHSSLAAAAARSVLTARPMIRHATFDGYARAAAPPRMPFFDLTQSLTSSITLAHQSLRRLHAERRDVASAIVALTHLLRHPATLPLCAQLQMPEQILPLVAHVIPEVRERAILFFTALARLPQGFQTSNPSQPPSAFVPLDRAPAEEAAAAADLLACFAQGATMHMLARPLHDSSEILRPRQAAVELMHILLSGEDLPTLIAMGRADVWIALARLVPPLFVPGQRTKCDLGARAVIVQVIERGLPTPLACLRAKPQIVAFLKDHGLELPAPQSLAGLAAAVDAEESGAPPPAATLLRDPRAALYAAHTKIPLESMSDTAVLRHAGACVRLLRHRGPAALKQERISLAILLQRGTACAARSLRVLAQRAENDCAMARLASGSREAEGSTALFADSSRATATETVCDAFVHLLHDVFMCADETGVIEELLVGSPAFSWICETAVAPTPLEAFAERRAARHKDDVMRALSAAAPVALDEPKTAVPLLRIGRACCELLVRHVLPSKEGGCVAEARRLELGHSLLRLISRQQAQVAAALLANELPHVLTDEYDASREMRMHMWRSLLEAPSMIPALLTASAPEQLIIVGALPHVRTLHANRRVPPSFLPHEGSIALRLEGIQMLADLLQRIDSATLEPVVQQFFAALRRHVVVPTEVRRLREMGSGAADVHCDSTAALRASAVLLLTLLDKSADMRAWQLLEESDAAATVFEIFYDTKAQPADLEELILGFHTMRNPLARAAASFVHGMFDFERDKLKTHPLLSADMRSLYQSMSRPLPTSEAANG